MLKENLDKVDDNSFPFDVLWKDEEEDSGFVKFIPYISIIVQVIILIIVIVK